MRKKHSLKRAVQIALISTSLTASIQSFASDINVEPEGKQKENAFYAGDTNKDGKLSLEEFFALHEAQVIKKAHEQFNLIDENKDGIITQDEFFSFFDQKTAIIDKLYKSYSNGGDGFKLEQFVAKQLEDATYGTMKNLWEFSRLDYDKSHALSYEEFVVYPITGIIDPSEPELPVEPPVKPPISVNPFPNPEPPIDIDPSEPELPVEPPIVIDPPISVNPFPNPEPPIDIDPSEPELPVEPPIVIDPPISVNPFPNPEIKKPVIEIPSNPEPQPVSAPVNPEAEKLQKRLNRTEKRIANMMRQLEKTDNERRQKRIERTIKRLKKQADKLQKKIDAL